MIKLIDDNNNNNNNNNDLKFFKKYGFSQITFLERSGTWNLSLKIFGINRPMWKKIFFEIFGWIFFSPKKNFL